MICRRRATPMRGPYYDRDIFVGRLVPATCAEFVVDVRHNLPANRFYEVKTNTKKQFLYFSHQSFFVGHFYFLEKNVCSSRGRFVLFIQPTGSRFGM
jgi:hypothetical protein